MTNEEDLIKTQKQILDEKLGSSINFMVKESLVKGILIGLLIGFVSGLLIFKYVLLI